MPSPSSVHVCTHTCPRGVDVCMCACARVLAHVITHVDGRKPVGMCRYRDVQVCVHTWMCRYTWAENPWISWEEGVTGTSHHSLCVYVPIMHAHMYMRVGEESECVHTCVCSPCPWAIGL